MLRIFILIMVMVPVSGNAHASLAHLQRFFAEVKTLQASFEQKVVDENGMLLEFASGRLTLSRPGKFRWDYADLSAGAGTTRQRGQQIVADGESILLYDPDLEQVTERGLQDALGQVPSLLLVQSGADLKEHFDITDIGLTDGLSWVALRPIDEDAGYQNLMIGFLQDQLNSIVLVDGLGNETRLSLSGVVSNTVLPANSFKLQVPDGTDFLRE